MNYKIVNTHNKEVTFTYNDRQITNKVTIKPKKDFILQIDKLPISLVKLQSLKQVDIQVLNDKQISNNYTTIKNEIKKVEKVVYPKVKRQVVKLENKINKRKNIKKDEEQDI